MIHAAEVVLLSVGAGIFVLCGLGVLLVDDPFSKLHFLAPGTTLAIPLIGIAVMLDQGHNRISVKIAVITVLVAAVQPAVTAATMRAVAASRGMARPEDSR
jgi:multicomponent Na+:H+ antiporter subunit G